MRVGFLQVYNEVNWIEYSLRQALKFSDKIIIIEGSQYSNYPNMPLHSDDGTLEIIEKWIEEYPKDIELLTTTRNYSNYRDNQAENFNRALKYCKKGDYFIPFDADEFYFDNSIKKINDITEEGKLDYLIGTGPYFAFSFNWRLFLDGEKYSYHQILFKKTRRLKFIRTHKPRYHGKNAINDSSGNWLNHYKWVRPTARILLRHETSGFYNGMLSWFNKNWNKIELYNGNKVEYYGGFFELREYNGKHPEVLEDHPWKSLDDIRNL